MGKKYFIKNLHIVIFIITFVKYKFIMKAKEFTKKVSPTKWGLREQLHDSGQLKFVHQWMDRYGKELAEHAFKAGSISSAMTFEQWYESFNEIKKTEY